MKLDPSTPVSFIEIGAGAGNFCIVSAQRSNKITYYIVDLPEMLAVSAHQVIKYIPNAEIYLPNEIDKGALKETTDAEKVFFFLTPSQMTSYPKMIV